MSDLQDAYYAGMSPEKAAKQAAKDQARVHRSFKPKPEKAEDDKKTSGK